MKTKIFSIAGWSGSGKTTLISRLTEKFKAKNKRVLVVKNVPHKYHLEPEGKDSFKFLQAGCSEVFLVARDEILSLQRNDDPGKIFALLEARAAAFDLVLLEGLFRQDIPIIEVFDSRKHQEPRLALDKLAAVVTDNERIGSLPCFRFGDTDGLVAFMEDYDGQKNSLKSR